MPPAVSAWIQLVLATPAILWTGWPFFTRGWASVDARVGKRGPKFRFINTHLEVFSASIRDRQTRALLDGPADTRRPVIIAGDFNDWMRTLSLSLQGSDLKLATNGKVKHPLTFPAFLPLLSLDRVYYKGLALEDFGVLDGRWGKSDHLPLVADFSRQ